jgi:hypothetical protein
MSIPKQCHDFHTVSGHEAMDLAKRLNEELAAQQSGSLGSQRPLSPDTETRSRSYDQSHKIKGKYRIENLFC